MQLVHPHARRLPENENLQTVTSEEPNQTQQQCSRRIPADRYAHRRTLANPKTSPKREPQVLRLAPQE